MKEVSRVVITDENTGFILLGKRAKGVAAGKWELPGGKVYPGESPDTAAIREVNEELGLNLTDIIHIVSVNTTVGPADEYMTHYFTGKVSGEVQLQPNEVAGILYIDPMLLHNEGIQIAFDHREQLIRYFS